MIIAVGSDNPSKVQAVEAAAAALHPGATVIACPGPSTVDAQPWGLGPTRRGAWERATRAARTADPRAVGIGLESGLQRLGGRIWVIGWVTACADGRRLANAQPAAYPLPEAVARHLESGGTQAEACAAVYGGTPADWSRQGTVFALTHGALDRRTLWMAPALLVLASLR